MSGEGERVPFRLVAGQTIPPGPNQSLAAFDWLGRFAGHGWLAYRHRARCASITSAPRQQLGSSASGRDGSEAGSEFFHQILQLSSSDSNAEEEGATLADKGTGEDVARVSWEQYGPKVVWPLAGARSSSLWIFLPSSHRYALKGFLSLAHLGRKAGADLTGGSGIGTEVDMPSLLWHLRELLGAATSWSLSHASGHPSPVTSISWTKSGDGIFVQQGRRKLQCGRSWPQTTPRLLSHWRYLCHSLNLLEGSGDAQFPRLRSWHPLLISLCPLRRSGEGHTRVKGPPGWCPCTRVVPSTREVPFTRVKCCLL